MAAAGRITNESATTRRLTALLTEVIYNVLRSGAHFRPEVLSSLYYANPLNTGAAKPMYLHNHGVVFKNVPYNASLDLNSQVKKITTDGEFVDMRHLLDSTRLRKAKIGIAYIQDIVRDS